LIDKMYSCIIFLLTEGTARIRLWLSSLFIFWWSQTIVCPQADNRHAGRQTDPEPRGILQAAHHFM